MKKVLFATTNPAKVGKYKKALEEKGIELITIKDLDFKLDIYENGKDAIENAYIKAKTYYDVTKIPTIGMDNNLFIEELPCERRNPGYPLDSISIMPKFNKYFVELTEEDKKQNKNKDNTDDVIEFIVHNI